MSKDEIRLWVGAQIPSGSIEEYRKCAENFILLLQKYEKGPQKWSYVKQFEEDQSFWKMFNLEKAPENSYGLVPEWAPYFIDVNRQIYLSLQL